MQDQKEKRKEKNPNIIFYKIRSYCAQNVEEQKSL